MAQMDLHPSLLCLSHDLSLRPSLPLLSYHFTSLSHRSNLLSLLFQNLHLNSLQPSSSLSRSSLLSFTELLSLHHFKSLTADLSSSNRIRLILIFDSVSAHFHELTSDLSTLLDILPFDHLPNINDVRDLIDLDHPPRHPDPDEEHNRSEMLDFIKEIELQRVPELEKLGLDDSRSCGAEIECLEREIGDGVCNKWSSAMISLVGLVRHGKCVLFGASTPRSEPHWRVQICGRVIGSRSARRLQVLGRAGADDGSGRRV